MSLHVASLKISATVASMRFGFYTAALIAGCSYAAQEA